MMTEKEKMQKQMLYDMDYTPRTLDEIIEGDARYHEKDPDAL